jgi:GcrA cell cycle regulator
VASLQCQEAPLRWSEQEKADLERLRAAGLSSSQIAAQLGRGITRNAVIGQANRMGLSVPNLTRSERKRAMEQLAIRFPMLVATPSVIVQEADPDIGLPEVSIEQPASVGVDPEGVAFFDLEPYHCRWPVGTATGAAMRYCGCVRAVRLAPVTREARRQPYCDAHLAVAYRRSEAPLKEAAE